MSNLKKLAQSRATIKGQMTRMKNSFETETSATEAEIRARKIEELWRKFEDVQEKIDGCRLDSLEVEGNEDAEAVIQIDSDAERVVFEQIYFTAAARAQECIDAAAQQQHAVRQQQGNFENNQNNNHGAQVERKSDIRLPTLKLPRFKGDYGEWLLFKDSYTSMIHNNTTLDPIEKYQYLRNALEGEALQVIGGLDPSAENYESAWELLTKNYENTTLLINIHLDELLDFSVGQKDKSAAMRQLIVHIRMHLKALKTLQLPVDKWDDLLIHLIKSKFDFNTQRDWEAEVNRDQMTRKTLEQFLTFLGDRCRTLEMLDRARGKQEITKSSTSKGKGKSVFLAATAQRSCTICTESHAMYKCPQFLQMTIPERVQVARSRKICMNCLEKGHFTAECKASVCKKCKKKHNTLLHLEYNEEESQNRKRSEEIATGAVVAHCSIEKESKTSEASTVAINFVRKPTSQVIISTARVSVEDADGNLQSCRLLLDPGSQSHLVTEDLVKRLRLKCRRRNELISGVNKSQTNIAKTTVVKIRSMYTDYKALLECLVLPTITERLPQVKINKKIICLPEGLQLADPNFHEPGEIDLLVGAALFWQLICPDSIKQSPGIPILQETLLGWIVGGELIASKTPSQFCGLVTNAALHAQLERFWNQEETQEIRRGTMEEVECERHFCETVARDPSGRFIVSLPKKSFVELGESENQATKRLYSLERRFKKDLEIKQNYIKFMEEYEQQQHMSILPKTEQTITVDTYTIPHQPVIRLDSVTTKLRVVFDASAKTTLGTALNDKLLVGPNLQNELFDIILRFRSHEFVMTADIAAMFRQIIVREQDRDLQRILWRKDSNQPIQTYRLNTVTYGTAPAPYLAIRCLRQLAEEETEFLRAATVLRNDFYMDDVLTGATTIEEARNLQQQLSQLLQRGQFSLRKWRSNDKRVLDRLHEDNELDNLLTLDKDGAVKTLGLLWDSKSDTLKYRVTVEASKNITKRSVLSKIAQIFDPLGLLGPIVINAKCIMQKMWQLKAGWDEPLPRELQEDWILYYNSLPKINDVEISRNVNPKNVARQFELIGFGDASEKAYGACLYAVFQNSKGQIESRLICSKSRVAPLKTVSLPRLELNAALLLAKLSDTARPAYGDKILSTSLWSDSTVVLSWIATSPNLLKTYVANRVSQIQELTQSITWIHVPSKDNPADLVSRGKTVEDWTHNELWWQGPKWLTSGKRPQRTEIFIDTSEMKASSVLVTTNSTCDILRKFSSFEKLKRVMAYCFRFKINALGEKKNGPLSCEELRRAEKCIVAMTQKEVFQPEIRALKENRDVPKSSKLASLSPYFDQEGLIRVGGRLSRADIPESQKHPIILPAKHNVTTMIVKAEHIQLHHCGPEQLLCSLRQKYWPVSGRREARKVTTSCLDCFRSKPRTPEVLMGDLPGERVCGSIRPFTNAGVDYAGPLKVRESRRRGRIHIAKSWIAVFTCLSTKAVHLELVTELTTEAFLAALRRFVARRGVCSQMISDNGTNFVGAARE